MTSNARQTCLSFADIFLVKLLYLNGQPGSVEIMDFIGVSNHFFRVKISVIGAQKGNSYTI